MIANLEIRRSYTGRLTPALKDQIVQLSGGHPGMINVLIDTAVESPGQFLDQSGVNALAQRSAVVGECDKLWKGLPQDEQQGLKGLAQRAIIPDNVRRRLELKGLVQGAPTHVIFSPLFARFVSEK